jgi:hypothetical protein
MQCCSQAVQQTVPLLLNPVTWLVVLAAVTGVVSKGKKGKK